jgi:hypothetical protein
MKLVERIVGRYARPQAMDLSFMVERPGTLQCDRRARPVDRAERVGNIFGLVAVRLADEAQGQMELIVVLPARAGHAAHQSKQRGSRLFGRAQGNEQPMHDNHLEAVATDRDRFRLKSLSTPPIFARRRCGA